MENTKKLKRHPGLNLVHGHGHESKNEIALFGFWVFMMSDLILFGLLFAIYLTTVGVTSGGPGPKELFDFTSLGIQTALLLTSSMTIGLATFALKHRRCSWQLVPWLLVTLALGGGFLYFEITDFMHMAAEGGLPTSQWLSVRILVTRRLARISRGSVECLDDHIADPTGSFWSSRHCQIANHATGFAMALFGCHLDWDFQHRFLLRVALWISMKNMKITKVTCEATFGASYFRLC